MSTQTIPVDSRHAGRAATAARSKRRDEGRAGWGLATPFLIFYVLFLIGPTVYGIVMSFFNSSLQHSGLGGFAGPDNYTRGADELRFLAVDVAHRAVHADDHAAAGRHRAGAGHLHRPARARTLVLPAGVLRPVRRPVGGDGADLDLALHPADRAVGQVAVRRRHHQPAELAGRPQLGDGLRRAGDRVVDARLQLRAVPRRPAGDPPEPVRGGRGRRGEPVAADPPYHDPAARAAPPRWCWCCRSSPR